MATKITKLGVNVGKTVNAGNYESFRADVYMEETRDVGDEPLSYGEVNQWRQDLTIAAMQELDEVLETLTTNHRS